jgi:hypothetical protein
VSVLLGKVRRAVDPQWALLVCALPLALLVFRARGGSLAEGEDIYVRFTLITADQTAAMCAAPEPIFGRSCGYRAPEPRPADAAEAGALQPFSTIGGGLYLVEDLFKSPALVARVQKEPPQGKNPKQLKRFEARCGLRLLGRAKSVHIRFGPTARWGAAPNLWVGVPHDCKVIG